MQVNTLSPRLRDRTIFSGFLSLPFCYLSSAFRSSQELPQDPTIMAPTPFFPERKTNVPQRLPSTMRPSLSSVNPSPLLCGDLFLFSWSLWAQTFFPPCLLMPQIFSPPLNLVNISSGFLLTLPGIYTHRRFNKVPPLSCVKRGLSGHQLSSPVMSMVSPFFFDPDAVYTFLRIKLGSPLLIQKETCPIPCLTLALSSSFGPLFSLPPFFPPLVLLWSAWCFSRLKIFASRRNRTGEFLTSARRFVSPPTNPLMSFPPPNSSMRAVFSLERWPYKIASETAYPMLLLPCHVTSIPQIRPFSPSLLRKVWVESPNPARRTVPSPFF